MTRYTHSEFARDLADQMIRERFGSIYGIETFDEYLAQVDARQTQHLADGLADHVLRASGEQRQRIKVTIENAATVILRVPLKDPRRPGAVVWAEIELATWLDLIENGADGAWYLNYASKEDRRGYVRTSPPMAHAGTCTLVTLGRLVAGAGKGRIVRFRDRNPLNLRRSNLFIVGNPATAEGSQKGAKHDARTLMANGAALRKSLTGAGFEIPVNEEK